MKHVLSLILLFFTMQATFATPFVVKGVVRYASNKETVPYCTISLTKNDSARTMIKAFPSSDVGVFEQQIETEGEYCLVFNAVGLTITERCFTAKANQKLNLGNIDLEEAVELLSEVSVVAQKPLVTMELDRLLYDTESDPETKTSNALDMLRKVPLVTVDGEDKIQIKGQSNFKIYINGKPSAMVSKNPEEVFRSLPASTIKRIEVITDPGAKYEAEGLAGILNIVTYTSLIGYNGSIRIAADIMGGANAGGYITTKIGKFGLSANLNYGTYNRYGSTNESEQINHNPNLIHRIYNIQEGHNRSHQAHGSLEMSYEFDSLNLLSVSAGGWGGSHTSWFEAYTMFQNIDLDTLTAYNQFTKNTNTWGGFNVNADYQHTFRKPEQNLTASYRYSGNPNSTKSTSDVVPLINYMPYNQRNRDKSNGSEHTFQIDYTEPWKNRQHVLEVGAKYILRINSSHNTNELFDSINGVWKPDIRINDNNLNQIQHVAGAYASYSFRYKWFGLRAGARLEHTTQSVTTDSFSLSPHFTNVVPSISLSFKLSQTQNLNVSYTQRLSRPSIWYLSPFYDNTNPLSIRQGNPNLDVERSHNVNISYGFFSPKFNFNISIYSTLVNNCITDVSSQLNDSATYTTYQNIGRQINSGGSLYINWQWGKIGRFTLNGWASNNIYDARNVPNVNKVTSGWNFGLHSGLQFFLPWQLKLNFNGGYWSPYIGLQSRGDHNYYYSASLQRSFLKNRLTAGISAQTFAELYQTNSFTTTTDTYTKHVDMRNRALNVNFSISYTFGEMREQIRKVNKSISNDDIKSK